jgi:hypothetical protein
MSEPPARTRTRLPPPRSVSLFYQAALEPSVRTTDGRSTKDGWWYVVGRSPGVEPRAYAGPFTTPVLAALAMADIPLTEHVPPKDRLVPRRRNGRRRTFWYPDGVRRIWTFK